MPAPRKFWRSLAASALLVGAIGGCNSTSPQAGEFQSDATADEQKPLVKETVRLPKNATEVEHSGTRLVLSLPVGAADSAVTALRMQFAGEGWDERTVVRHELAGTIWFVRQRQEIALTYADTEAVPAEIVLQATGVELAVDEQR